MMSQRDLRNPRDPQESASQFPIRGIPAARGMPGPLTRLSQAAFFSADYRSESGKLH